MAVSLGLAACGSSAHHPAAASQGGAASTPAPQAAGFGWLRAQTAPAGWGSARIPTGAVMAFPPGWHATETDRGTATEVLVGGHGRLEGYLNLTPRTPNEMLSNWARFRVNHNSEDNDRQVRSLAAGRGLRFATGTGSCVRDSYTTSTDAHYVEIACLVVGSHSGVVIVTAAPPTAWHRLAPQLERVVESVRT